MKFLSYLFFFTFFLIGNASYSNEFTCTDLKNFLITNPIISPPIQEDVNDFGFNFLGYYDEDENFIYDIDESNGEGINIKKIFNQTFNDNFHITDEDNRQVPIHLITKINSINLKELFASKSIENASLEINDLFKKNQFLNIEAKNVIDNEFNKKLEIFKEVYKKPLHVYLNFRLDDITFIDIKKNTYTSKYALLTDWQDNRFNKHLKKIKDNNCSYKSIKESDDLYKSIWMPELIAENKIENIDSFDNFQYANIDIYLYEDGNSYILVEKINNAMFNIQFDLQEFPFDQQSFVYRFYTPEINTEISINEWHTPSYKESNNNLFLTDIKHPEWNYKDIDEFFYAAPYNDGTFFDKYEFMVTADRNISYYLTKVIIPIFIILIICWSVFWVSGLQLESRLTVTSVSFLALIAYNYVVEDDLPKLGYSTIIDNIILCSYVFAGLATILTIYSYKNCKLNNYDFCSVDYIARYLGPIVYITINGALIFNGIKSMTAGEFMGRFL